MTVENTLAYYDMATITHVKVLLEQAQGGSVENVQNDCL
jgi:hypothetical protein